MRVSKSFRWDAAHRLPRHDGLCRNLHGHSYRMTVEMEGPPDEHGIVIDFREIKALVKPLVEAWDHATLVSADDVELMEAVERLGDRCVPLPVESTAENLCVLVAEHVLSQGREVLSRRRIQSVRIRIYETESSFAEHEVQVA